ncbi:MAG: aminotransferase class V-fold PLP-dependent enzyme, partial [Verrucomicrobia bacterium]|nr:aminotransferase class V-fold PLP-dependent enzyme [Verrucomicrobiota bacterium]
MLYFDNNATTRVDPLVVEAMLPYLGELYGNPSSGCRLGKLAANAIERARE